MHDHPATLGAALSTTAQAHADRPAIIGDAGSHSFAELNARVDRLSAALVRDGVRKGDAVGIWMPTGFDFLTVFCAAARIGAVAVPVNTRYQAEEVHHVLATAWVGILFAQPQMWRTNAWETLCRIEPGLSGGTGHGRGLTRLPSLRRVILTGAAGPEGIDTLDSYIEHGANAAAVGASAVQESDPLLICFTSGSTGSPKGVVHSHRVLRHCRRLAEVQGLVPGERSLANWPMHHAGGLFLLMLPSLLSGATLVEIGQWSGAEAIRLIERYRVTVMGGIPTHYLDIIDAPEAADSDLSSLRYCYMGGANVARDLFDRIVDVLRLDALPSTYGLTENTVSATFNLPGDSAEQCSRNIAPVVADCEVRIADPLTGQPLPTGEPGEVQFRGATVMVGYHGDPAATRAVMTSDGWLRTGDLGVVHPNGYLQPTGRLKEMLKVGGSNVSPTEVETVLNEHPAVRNAVVVGIADRRLTEVPYAFVERRPGEAISAAAIIDHCRARLADYKVPRHVEFLDALPRLSTGKVDRSGLASRARDVVRVDSFVHK